MERNANRVRIALFALLIFIGQSVFGQKNQDVDTVGGDYYSPVSFDISVNTSKFIFDNDTIPVLSYDYGVGLNVEKEIYYSTKFSLIFSAGLHLNKSSTTNNNYFYRALSGRVYITPRYFLSNTISLYGGLAGFYTIKQTEKESYLVNWQSNSRVKKLQPGFVIGCDLLLTNWLSLRPRLVINQQVRIFEAGFVVTPTALL